MKNLAHDTAPIPVPEKPAPMTAPLFSRDHLRAQRDVRRQNYRLNRHLSFSGEPVIWLSASALTLALLMIVGILSLIFLEGFSTFWPGPLSQIKLHDGTVILGEETRRERVYSEAEHQFEDRRLIRVGNFDISGKHFQWVRQQDIVEETFPQAVLVERKEWGRFYGFLKSEADQVLAFETAQGQSKELRRVDMVRMFLPNDLGIFGKLQVYAARWIEFVIAEPREANNEGGIFPAIFGTVAMTLIMTLFVVPFGVLTALYLREYAKNGWAIRATRIAVNNLAGVPSIVFGVFGLGFFCYIFGANIDQVFFSQHLPNPTFGKGGILWASLTLSLLTLPVVIVATEEALAAVPNSMREGSYGCGASKWQTIRYIVLPRALPGIITGGILAIARGAGEVAPLMLVGAVKLAPNLPLDTTAPFIHPERSFMHLGFHIYDLAFQSQNSEAAKPVVFTTALLLILIVLGLNILALILRAKLRRRYVDRRF